MLDHLVFSEGWVYRLCGRWKDFIDIAVGNSYEDQYITKIATACELLRKDGQNILVLEIKLRYRGAVPLASQDAPRQE